MLEVQEIAAFRKRLPLPRIYYPTGEKVQKKQKEQEAQEAIVDKELEEAPRTTTAPSQEGFYHFRSDEEEDFNPSMADGQINED